MNKNLSIAMLFFFQFVYCHDITSNSLAIKGLKSHKKTLANKPIPSKKTKLFTLRKHDHVTTLFDNLTKDVIELCITYKCPPAAILSIAALESGWNQGYVSQITGNILSLNATGNAAELPSLYLPVLKRNGKVLLDQSKIGKYKDDELSYEQRPASLKKDYRPLGIAGTTTKLDYFILHPNQQKEANLKCISDFITRFIKSSSSIAVYREARSMLDKAIELHGEGILFNKELNIKFINTIGGRPNSFNYRETWPKKVITILNKVGATELTKEMHINKKAFEESW